MIEAKLKEIPKIAQQHKAQAAREKLRASKDFKGTRLMQTPTLSPPPRSPHSTVTKRERAPLPTLPKNLQRVVQGRHLTELPPHLQAEKDRLKAEREQQ